MELTGLGPKLTGLKFLVVSFMQVFTVCLIEDTLLIN